MTAFFGQPTARLAAILAALLLAGLLLLALLALRNPILFKLGVRNVGRRKTQTVLIAVGLMLSTMLMTAALGVGDVIGGTIQAVAVGSLGRTDELLYTPSHSPFDPATVARAQPSLSASTAIAGVMPVVQQSGQLLADRRARQIARVDLLGVPAVIPPIFGPLHGPGVSLIDPTTLGPNEVLLNPKAIVALSPAPGDPLYWFHDGKRTALHVRALINAPGLTGLRPVAIMGSSALAALEGWPGQANVVVVANRGSAGSSADATDAAVADLQTALPAFIVDTVKRSGVDTFARAQDIFTRVFLLFTLFAAGISLLLILLVFTLLAAERRSEIGVARALGTQRGHVVQTFLFEGVVYDLVAAGLGVGVGLSLGTVLTRVLSQQLVALGIDTAGQVQPRSLLLAYALGALCTGLTITLAAWWIGHTTIVAALRGLSAARPSRTTADLARRGRRSLALLGRAAVQRRLLLTLRVLLHDLPLLLVVLLWRIAVGGLPLLVSGLLLLRVGYDDWSPLLFALGVTTAILGALLTLRLVLHVWGVPPRLADRLAATPGGLLLLAYWAVPLTQFDQWGWPRFTDGVEVFFVSGLMMVAGAVVTAVYNIDLVLRPLLTVLAMLGRAAIARAALAYPLHDRGRSGLALALFSLVAFTLTVMAVIIGATAHSYGDLTAAGNGFDLHAEPAFGSIGAVDRAVNGLPYLPRGTLAAAGTATVSAIGVVQLDAPRPGWTLYALNRLSDGFLAGTTLHLSTRASGYPSDAAVWAALRRHPGLAVIDSGAVLSGQGYAVAPPPLPPALSTAPLFVLTGVRIEDRSMAPIPLWVADPSRGRAVRLTVIGVVDSRAVETYGLLTSARSLAGSGFPDRPPTTYYFKAAPGVDAHLAMQRVEAAYLPYGLQATVVADELLNGLGPKQILSAVLQGFVGLTLLMGVAAVGLIAARAVIERHHSIGTMRALGYSRTMVGLSFLAESLFIALVGVAIGGGLGIVLSKNLFDANFFEQYRTGLTFAVPWQTLIAMALSALVATAAATLVPAWQASRIVPAEALRYA